jgi:hypothetical protein
MSGPLGGWYERSGVRSQPRRMLDEDLEVGLVPFPHRLMPYLDHEGLAALTPAARTALSAHHLYEYLLFTVNLETRVVNRGVEMLAHDQAGFPVPVQTRLDALRIYCDEGYHALYSLDAIAQVHQVTGVRPLPYDFGPRLQRLDRSARRFLPEHPQLARLVQVVVFETVVTSVLSDLPRDPTVFRLVRDEATHHAFFVLFFKQLWGALSPQLRVAVGRVMPHLVDDCLRPDLGPVRAALVQVGLGPRLVDDVLHDCYPEHAVRAGVRAAGRQTLRLCESLGVFDEPGAREELHELELVV